MCPITVLHDNILLVLHVQQYTHMNRLDILLMYFISAILFAVPFDISACSPFSQVRVIVKVCNTLFRYIKVSEQKEPSLFTSYIVTSVLYRHWRFRLSYQELNIHKYRNIYYNPYSFFHNCLNRKAQVKILLASY